MASEMKSKSRTCWEILDIDYLGLGRVVIQIEEDTNPIRAAQLLHTGLLRSLAYPEVKNQIPTDDFDNLKAAYKASVAEAAKVVTAGAELYLAGLSVANEGLDFVITLQEVSDGNYAAAIGFLPVVTGGNGKWRKK